MATTEAIIMEEPLLTPVPNVKYETEDQSEGQLKISNVFSLIATSQLFRDSNEDLDDTVLSIKLPRRDAFLEDLPPGSTTLDGSGGIGSSIVQTSRDELFVEERNCPLLPVKVGRNFQCDFCLLLFFNVESLEEHVADVHVVDKEFNCADCDESFISQEKLECHMDEHKEGKEGKSGNKCPLCYKTYTRRSTLTQHLMGHQGLRPFKCQLCPKSYVKGSYLKVHEISSHGIGKTLKCTKCPKTFPYKYTLEDHLRTHSDARTIICENCRECFKTKGNLRGHKRYCKGRSSSQGSKSLELENRDNRHECSICSKTFARSQFLRKHRLTVHLGVRPFKCKLCPKSFAQRHAFEVHEIRYHGKAKKFKCPECPNAFFVSRSDFEDHLRLHSNVNTQVCGYCSQSFTTRSKVRRHRLRCIGPSSAPGLQTTELEKCEKANGLKCPICSKPFTSKRPHDLKRHLRTHDAVKPLKCDLCPKSFIQRTNLEAHKMNRHGKPKRFNCPICPRSFPYNYVLKDHILTHYDAKTMVCEDCSATFKTKVALNNHRLLCEGVMSKTKLSNHGEVVKSIKEDRPFKCPKCSKAFAYNYILEDHLRTHSSDKTLGCENCGMYFKTKNSLYRHKRRCMATCSAQITATQHERDANPVSSKEIVRNVSQEVPMKHHPIPSYTDTWVHVNSCESLESETTLNNNIKSSQETYSTNVVSVAGNVCPICSKTLVSKKPSNMRKHMMTHAADKPFKCKLCPKSYVQRIDLQTHEMGKHGKQKQIKCPKCPKFFSTSSAMKKHLRTHSNK